MRVILALPCVFVNDIEFGESSRFKISLFPHGKLKYMQDENQSYAYFGPFRSIYHMVFQKFISHLSAYIAMSLWPILANERAS